MTVYATPALSFHGLHVPAFEFSAVRFEACLLYGRAVFLVFCFLLASFSFTRWRRQAQRDAALAHETTRAVLERLSGIETELQRLQESATGIATRVAALAGKLEETAPAATPAGAAAYDIAVRMARGGASRDELVTLTGLSQPEADLAVRLHAAAAPAGLAA